MGEEQKQTAIVERVPIQADHRGLILDSLESMYRYAQCIFKTPFKPKGFDNIESIVVAIDYGANLGLSALQAIQNIAVINGRPCVWGDMLLAICQKSPLFDHAAFVEAVEGEGESRVAHCTVRRKGAQPSKRSFSWQDAMSARLTDRDTYKMYPKRMLQMRARAFALRDTFADVLKGLYAREELDADSFEQSAAVIGPVKRPALAMDSRAALDAALGVGPDASIPPPAGVVDEPFGSSEQLPDGEASAMRATLWAEMKRAAGVDKELSKSAMTIDGTVYRMEKSLCGLDMPTMTTKLNLLKGIVREEAKA